MKRVALYVRVSTQEQKNHGLSVDSQLVALQDYCKDNHYTIAGIYNDAGISAHIKYTKRPALLQMLDDCRNRKIDLVIFTKLDRFFRSVQDYYACIEQMNNVPWKAIWEDYETETSAGKFKVNIMLSVAQAEADRTSERIKSVNEYKRNQGHYVGGKAPTGYLIQKKDLVIDPDKKEVIRGFFEQYLSSFNITYSVDWLHKHGIMSTRDTVLKWLKNPTYKGDAYGYKCEAYITEEEWDNIQQSLDSRKVRRTKDAFRTYLFTGGLIKCAHCGANMCGSVRIFTSTSKKHPNKRIDYKFYKCGKARNQSGCSNIKSTSEKVIERYLIDHIEEAVAGYNLSLESNENNIDAEKQIIALKNKITRIGDRYEEGEISKEEYQAKKQTINEQIKRLQDIKPKTKKTLPEGWHEIYDTLDDNHRRALWYSVLSRIEVDNEQTIKLFF